MKRQASTNKKLPSLNPVDHELQLPGGQGTFAAGRFEGFRLWIESFHEATMDAKEHPYVETLDAHHWEVFAM